MRTRVYTPVANEKLLLWVRVQKSISQVFPSGRGTLYKIFFFAGSLDIILQNDFFKSVPVLGHWKFTLIYVTVVFI